MKWGGWSWVVDIATAGGWWCKTSSSREHFPTSARTRLNTGQGEDRAVRGVSSSSSREHFPALLFFLLKLGT